MVDPFTTINTIKIYQCFKFVVFEIYYIIKILFPLALIQQSTLIILLFFWDPSKSIDFKMFYIDFIFFICFAICDNLWTTHNLSNNDRLV